MNSSSSSGEEYIPDLEDSESEDSISESESEYSDDGELEIGGWKRISDIFSDRRPDPRPSFGEVSGLDPIINGNETFPEPKDAFTSFVDVDLVSQLCD